MAKTDFFLISAETEPSLAPRECAIVGRLQLAGRDDLAVVEVSPPIKKGTYGNPFGEITELILAARWEGTSLFPPSKWPLAVFICQFREPEIRIQGPVSTKDIEILSWGLILSSLCEAQKWLETGNSRGRV